MEEKKTTVIDFGITEEELKVVTIWACVGFIAYICAMTLLPWIIVRVIMLIVFTVYMTLSFCLAVGMMKELSNKECSNQKIFGNKPIDCRIRRSDDGGTETIDDLDFPNSRK